MAKNNHIKYIGIIVLIGIAVFSLIYFSQTSKDKNICASPIKYAIFSNSNFLLYEEGIPIPIKYGKVGENKVVLKECHTAKIYCYGENEFEVQNSYDGSPLENATINLEFIVEAKNTIPVDCYNNMCFYEKTNILEVCK